MTARQIFDTVMNALEPVYGKDEAQGMAFLLLEHLGVMKTAVLARQPMQTDTAILEKWVKRLRNHEPIQYVLGEAHFYKRTFKVSEAVLIPRPETEELAAWIIADYTYSSSGNQPTKPVLLDIGTGSGCLAVTLAKEIQDSMVFALDISAEALRIAAENARLNQAKITFMEQDILNEFAFEPELDVVVSNPPYVTDSEKSGMSLNVLNFEPHQALFVPDEKPQLFYSRLAQLSRNLLKTGGNCYLELNPNFAFETAALFDKQGFSKVEIRKDLSGKNRMLKATL